MPFTKIKKRNNIFTVRTVFKQYYFLIFFTLELLLENWRSVTVCQPLEIFYFFLNNVRLAFCFRKIITIFNRTIVDRRL